MPSEPDAVRCSVEELEDSEFSSNIESGYPSLLKGFWVGVEDMEGRRNFLGAWDFVNFSSFWKYSLSISARFLLNVCTSRVSTHKQKGIRKVWLNKGHIM